MESLQKWLAQFFLIRSNGETHRNKPFSSQKNNLAQFWSDKGFKGTLANRVLSFLHGGSLQITYSFPLSFIMSLFVIWLKTTNRVVFWISGFLPFSQVHFSNMKSEKKSQGPNLMNWRGGWTTYCRFKSWITDSNSLILKYESVIQDLNRWLVVQRPSSTS